MGRNQSEIAITSLYMLLNIGLSIAIVLINKSIYEFYHFPSMTLTCLHLIFTTIGMCGCRIIGLFEPVKLPIFKMLPIAGSFGAFIVTTNLSLQWNTVGTYQIIKSATIPLVIIVQIMHYQRTFSTKIKITVIPILVGVYLNSYYDIKFNLKGAIYAAAGVISTTFYQVWVGEKQKEFNVNSMQLLYYQAPLSSLMLMVIIPFFEPVTSEGGLLTTTWSASAVAMVVISGIIAFAVNLSVYWIIGNTSPHTYNMMGQFKSSMMILGGWLLFRDPMNLLQVSGITCTFLGVFAYTWLKLKGSEVNQVMEPKTESEDGKV